MASMNEVMLEDLTQKSEAIINDLGGATRSLLKYSEIHEVFCVYFKIIFDVDFVRN